MLNKTSSEHERLVPFGELIREALNFEMNALAVLIQVRLPEI